MDKDISAFPSIAITPSGGVVGDFGMTLRDYFAGQALMDDATTDRDFHKVVAENCYQLADAMMEAREK